MTVIHRDQAAEARASGVDGRHEFVTPTQYPVGRGVCAALSFVLLGLVFFELLTVWVAFEKPHTLIYISSLFPLYAGTVIVFLLVRCLVVLFDISDSVIGR